jgi:AraC family transcriptional regulator, L-rhamnose operon transcriptional activator RhaR
VVDHEHASRYTAGMFIAPGSAVGFFPAYHHFAIPWHDHDFYEIGIVESGSGMHVSSTGSEPFRRGTVVLVPPGAGHEYRTCVEMQVLNVFFRAELDELELSWAFRDTSLRRLFYPTGTAVPRHERPVVVRQLDELELGRMMGALEAIRSLSPNRRTHAAELGHLLVALDSLAAGAATGATPLPDRAVTSHLVSDACQLLEGDPAYPWTLAELSARLYVGPFHLARQFVRSLGMPPMRYLARWRAQRAAGLLVSTDQSVAAIGAAVGWPDPSQFSRRFRAEFGVSPRAYRRHVAVLAGIPAPVDQAASRAS